MQPQSDFKSLPWVCDCFLSLGCSILFLQLGFRHTQKQNDILQDWPCHFFPLCIHMSNNQSVGSLDSQ